MSTKYKRESQITPELFEQYKNNSKQIFVEIGKDYQVWLEPDEYEEYLKNGSFVLRTTPDWYIDLLTDYGPIYDIDEKYLNTTVF